MKLKQKYEFLTQYFSENLPEAQTELQYQNPYELLVAVVLSAQCTDKRVNMVTSALFERFPTVQDLAHTTFEELFPYIKSISYPNNKTKHLIAAAQKIMNDFAGQIPESIDDLQKLQGVGRKTANVIASVVYEKPTMAVDTHVFRVSHRLGLVSKNDTTPLAVEKKLTKHIPKNLIAKAHHWLILHGRYTCTARNPKCENCGLKAICSYFDKQEKNKG